MCFLYTFSITPYLIEKSREDLYSDADKLANGDYEENDAFKDQINKVDVINTSHGVSKMNNPITADNDGEVIKMTNSRFV